MDKLGNRRRIAAISAASLLCAASTVSAAIPATFTRIVDTNTPMPEWTPQSPLVFGSGIALAAAGAVAALPMAILAFASNRAEVIGDAGLVRALYDGYLMMGNVLIIMCGLFVAATGAAMVRRELGAAWLGWAGLAVAAVDWIAGIAGFYVSTYNAFWSAVGYVGLIAFMLFVLVAAGAMLREPEVKRSTAARPVFGH